MSTGGLKRRDVSPCINLIVELLVVVLVDQLLERPVDLGLILVLHQGRVVTLKGSIFQI